MWANESIGERNQIERRTFAMRLKEKEEENKKIKKREKKCGATRT